MRSPINTYNDQTNKSKLRKEVFSMFEKKYVKQPFTVFDDLFETNERVLAKKLNFFLPGRIYTWQYDPEGKDYLDFYDKRPIVLVHSQFQAKTTGNTIVQGLNLNFLPELQRVETMEIFWQLFKKDIEQAEQKIDKDEIGLITRAWQYLTDWYFTTKVFNQQGKIGYQWAYRNYIIKRIAQPVLIELEDWELIPYFLPKEFQGKQPAQVWSEYVQYKSQLAKVTGNEKKSTKNKQRYTRPGGS